MINLEEKYSKEIQDFINEYEVTYDNAVKQIQYSSFWWRHPCDRDEVVITEKCDIIECICHIGLNHNDICPDCWNYCLNGSYHDCFWCHVIPLEHKEPDKWIKKLLKEYDEKHQDRSSH